MKKVAHIITKSEIGGAQTWVRDQIFLLSQDVENFLITNKEGWLTDNTEVSASALIPEIESKFSIFAFFKVLRFVKKNKIDILIASSANAGVYARMIKLFYNCRVIYVSHGWSCIYNGGQLKFLFIFIEKLLSYLSDSILCVSDRDLKDAVDIIGIDINKVTVIRNCVYPRERVIETLFPYGPCRILFLGRLAPPKRPDLLIEAISKIQNVQLDIVGDGPLRNFLQKHDNVQLLGAINNFDSFSGYDLFALISDSEGLPMSALEAASSGLPLLISNVGGCPEIVEKNGILVENTVDSIVNSIELFKREHSEFKIQALHRVDDFNINNYRKCYLRFYWGVES